MPEACQKKRERKGLSIFLSRWYFNVEAPKFAKF
jgi:hypothetical protein